MNITELDFEQDRSVLLDYVADKLILAECGDESAISFIEFLWDREPDLLSEAQDLVLTLDSIEDYYIG